MLNESSLSSYRLESAPAINVKIERIKFLYRGIPTAIAVNIAISLLTLWVLWDRVDHQPLLYWFAAISFITLLRVISTYQYRLADVTNDNIQSWYYIFLVLTTCSGIAWGITIWLFNPVNEIITPVLMVFILGGLIAGGAAVLGSVLTAYYSYVVVTMLPSTVWFYLEGSDSFFIMGVMLTIYMVTMMAAGYLYRKILIGSISVSKELVEAKNKAESANRAKSDFLSSMSHEIRMPLNAVIGFSQLLKMDNNSSLDDDQRESVDFILSSGRHLLDLINQVLELTKIEANVAPLKLEEVAYREVLDECIPLIQVVASKKEITIDSFDSSANNYVLWADRVKLKQVIINLLDNATKYNQKGGSVSLTCKKTKDDFLRIEISDTGEGIAEEEKDKVFQPFERLGYENSPIEGTGIGLLVTKRIIEQMHGRIGFSSEKGKGTQFWVELPIVS